MICGCPLSPSVAIVMGFGCAGLYVCTTACREACAFGVSNVCVLTYVP
jgi:hypothetical protein